MFMQTRKNDKEKEQEQRVLSAIDPMMLELFKAAIKKNNIINNEDANIEMLVIEVYPDEFVHCDKVKLDYCRDKGIVTDALSLANQITQSSKNKKYEIANFLKTLFGLNDNVSLRLMDNGSDPRFGDNRYAPDYHRVAINVIYKEDLENFCRQHDKVNSSTNQITEVNSSRRSWVLG